MAKDATQDLWPRWPAGHEHPLSLVDVRVKLDVDKLFHLLYAPGSEYVVSTTDSDGTITSLQYSRHVSKVNLFGPKLNSIDDHPSNDHRWSALQAQSQEVRGNKDYVETPWVSDMTELAEAELAPPPPHSKAAQMDVRGFEGRLRKTSCLGLSMGMKV